MRRAAAVLACSVALALTGCAAQPAEPITLAAATRTVSRPPTAPIDGFDAWYYCRSRVFEFAAGTKPASDPFTANPYAAKYVRHERDGYRVQIVGRLGDGYRTRGVNAAWCVVAGTLAHPRILRYLYPR